eukprot:6188579-Pleurochrysis_carterae.AAC.4
MRACAFGGKEGNHTELKKGSHMRRVSAMDFEYVSLNLFCAMASLPSYTSNHTRMSHRPQQRVCNSRPMGMGYLRFTINPGMLLPSQRAIDLSNTISHEQTTAA